MEGVIVVVTYTYVADVVEELESLNLGIYIADAGSDSCPYHLTEKNPTQTLISVHTFIAQCMHVNSRNNG